MIDPYRTDHLRWAAELRRIRRFAGDERTERSDQLVLNLFFTGGLADDDGNAINPGDKLPPEFAWLEDASLVGVLQRADLDLPR